MFGLRSVSELQWKRRDVCSEVLEEPHAYKQLPEKWNHHPYLLLLGGAPVRARESLPRIPLLCPLILKLGPYS